MPQPFRLYSANGNFLADLAQESGSVPGWQNRHLRNAGRHFRKHHIRCDLLCALWASRLLQHWVGAGCECRAAPRPRKLHRGDNGVHVRRDGFPTQSRRATNYFVEVAFTPAAPAPYLSLSPNPSIPSTTRLGASVATITATWSDGTPFAGTLSFGPSIRMPTGHSPFPAII